MTGVNCVKNTLPKTEDRYFSHMTVEKGGKAREFHRSFPQYAETPLASLDGAAAELGFGKIYVKDESARFGLNAFKALGGSFAIANCAAEKLSRDVGECGYPYLASPALRRDFGQAVFFTATDGNHGRGVAWAARVLGQKAVVFMPKGSRRERFDNIAAEGARVTIEALNYDGCVRKAAAECAGTPGGVLIQDTAWDGYEKVPLWIMEGYCTMAAEAAEQMGERPTHVFVQAGVGSMAAAVIGYLAHLYRDAPPVFTVVEAAAADCLYRSALRGDGERVAVGGDLDTEMAGLACGEASTVAWDILRNHADFFVSAPDWVTEAGMRKLARPAAGDPAVTSGESGAVCFGLLTALTGECAPLRAELGLDNNSRVLLFSTEGATDRERWNEIVIGTRLG